MKKFILIACWLLTTSLCMAQQRTERPLQVQVNFSGLFIKLAGNALADPTVDDLSVNAWKPGFSVGYHFNRYIYVGYSLYAPLDMTLKESWGLTGTVLDANIILAHQTGAIHNLEARISPFKFGLFASVGYSNLRETKYQMQMTRINETLLIGNNSYPTDLEIHWNAEKSQSASLGLGYTHVTKSGFSFTLAINAPLRFPKDENIVITPTNTSVNILSSDLTLAKQMIEEETFYGPVMFLLNLGYNFHRLWE